MGKLEPQNIKNADKIYEGCVKLSNSIIKSMNNSSSNKTDKIEKNKEKDIKHKIKGRRKSKKM